MGFFKSYDLKYVLSRSSVLCEALLSRGMIFNRLLESFYHRSLVRFVCKHFTLVKDAGQYTARLSLPHGPFRAEGLGFSSKPGIAKFRALLDVARTCTTSIARPNTHKAFRLSIYPLCIMPDLRSFEISRPLFAEFITRDSNYYRTNGMAGVGYPSPLRTLQEEMTPVVAHVESERDPAVAPLVQQNLPDQSKCFSRTARAEALAHGVSFSPCVEDVLMKETLIPVETRDFGGPCVFMPGSVCTLTRSLHSNFVSMDLAAYISQFRLGTEARSRADRVYKTVHGDSCRTNFDALRPLLPRIKTPHEAAMDDYLFGRSSINPNACKT